MVLSQSAGFDRAARPSRNCSRLAAKKRVIALELRNAFSSARLRRVQPLHVTNWSNSSDG